MNDFIIPTDVPKEMQETYRTNYETITHKTGNLMLFSADQKIEHLNDDFYGPGIHEDAMHPHHLFSIASQGRIGAMATHLGLIARYASQYPTINYIAKLNAKTNIVPTKKKDPNSALLWDVHQVIEMKQQSNVNIRGIGLTVYLGSTHENDMLTNAAQTISEAHLHGLVAIVWMYPRGEYVSDEKKPELIAGACGVAASIGADFVKVNPPSPTKKLSSVQALKIAVAAAGNTKVLCSGGKLIMPKQFLQELYDQIHIGGTAGNATGRNIFQHSLGEAIAMTDAISAIVLDDATVIEAMKMLEKVS